MKSASQPLVVSLVLLALSLTFSQACFQGTEGESGNFTFHDNTPEPGEILNLDRSFDRDIAVGATVNIRVQQNSQAFRPTSADSSDTQVLRVDDFFETGVVVQAVGTGEARLTVRRGDVEDSIVLRVAEIGQTIIHLYPVGPLASGVKGLDTTNVVMTPESRIWGFVEQRGTSNERLTGFGATPCVLEALAPGLTPDDNSDSFTLDALQDEGELTLECGATSLTLPVAGPEVAVELDTYDYLHGEFGPTFDGVKPGERLYLVLLAYDDQDRLVQGSALEPVVLTVADEDAPYVLQPETLGSEELDDLLLQSRAVALDFAADGSYSVELGWLELTTEVLVDVTVAESAQ